MMRRFLIALYALLAIGGAAAIADYTATQGAGTSFGSIIRVGVHYAQFMLCDLTTPGQCASVSAAGAVKVDGSGFLQPVSMTSTTITGTVATNTSQINGVTPLMGNGATGTGSQRVTIASDNTFPAGWGASTLASGSVASGAYASGSIASGAYASGAYASGSISSGAFAAGSIASGAMVDLGAQADPACTTDNGTCSEIALIKRTNQRLTSMLGGTTSLITGWGGGTLGAMANYGTSPGAVLVPGVNAFVTNATPLGQASAANSSPVVPPNDMSAPLGNIAANNTTAVVVNAAATTLYSVQLYGIGSAPAYLKLYNATSATCGSGTPVKRLMIPAAATAANGAGSNISFPWGVRFTTGLTYCVTTGITDADTTAPAASTFLINLDWK